MYYFHIVGHRSLLNKLQTVVEQTQSKNFLDYFWPSNEYQTTYMYYTNNLQCLLVITCSTLTFTTPLSDGYQ